MFGYDWARGYVAPFTDKNGVPYATPPEAIEALLAVIKEDPPRLVIDLGSGDGRIVHAAARANLCAHGVELNGDLVESSRQKATAASLSCTFEEASLLEVAVPADAFVERFDVEPSSDFSAK